MGKIIKLTKQQLQEAAPEITKALIAEGWTEFNSTDEIIRALAANPSVDDWFGLLDSDAIKSARKNTTDGCTIYDLTADGITNKEIRKIMKFHKALSHSSTEFVVSDNNVEGGYFVFNALYTGKNGSGNSALTDTRQVYYMARKALGLGIKFRISDASFDIVDDVSTFLIVFDLPDKSSKRK